MLVLAVFIGPTLAIAWVIPAGQISFTTGVMQAFDSLFDHFGVGFGFISPSQFGHSNPLGYALLILAGLLAIGILPPLLMDRLRKPGWKAPGTSAPQP